MLSLGTSRQSPIGYSKRIQTSRINSSTVRYTEMMRQPISKINRRKSSYLHRVRINHPRMPQRKISTVPLERLPTRQTSKIRSRWSSNPMAQHREKVKESTSSRITIPGSFFFRVGKQSLQAYQIQTALELSMWLHMRISRISLKYRSISRKWPRWFWTMRTRWYSQVQKMVQLDFWALLTKMAGRKRLQSHR